jgi:hypothetical protein
MKEARMDERRSTRVRKILQLQGRAATLQSRYEAAMVRIAPARHQAEELRQQALALKVKLTRDELCQLGRARRCGVRPPMATRVEYDFRHGLTAPTIERDDDGGPVLSLDHGQDRVVIALSESSLRALGLAILTSIGDEAC